MAIPIQEIDSIEVAFHLSCYLREDDGAWIAGCPSLNVVTQADAKEGARSALEEAVEMWVDSCLERETLGEALRELGWHRILAGDEASAGESRSLMVPPATAVEGWDESFQLTMRVPAYRIDHLLGFEERASG